MNKLMLLCGLFLSTAAFAGEIEIRGIQPATNEPTVEPTSDQTRFDRLMELFETGSEPTDADVTGWNSGRCYNFDTPNDAEPSLLAGTVFTSATPPNEGPLFPPSTPSSALSIMVVVSLQSSAPDFFDNMDESVQSQLQSLLGQYTYEDFVTTRVSGSFVTEIARHNVRSQARKLSNGYLVLKSDAIEGADPIKAGQTVSACYYFKKVQ